MEYVTVDKTKTANALKSFASRRGMNGKALMHHIFTALEKHYYKPNNLTAPTKATPSTLYRWAAGHNAKGVPRQAWEVVERSLELPPGALSKPFKRAMNDNGTTVTSLLERLANFETIVMPSKGSNDFKPSNEHQFIQIGIRVSFQTVIERWDDASGFNFRAPVYLDASDALLFLQESTLTQEPPYATGAKPERVSDDITVQNLLSDPLMRVAARWVFRSNAGAALSGVMELPYLAEVYGKFAGADELVLQAHENSVSVGNLIGSDMPDEGRPLIVAQIRRRLLEKHLRRSMHDDKALILRSRAIEVPVSHENTT